MWQSEVVVCARASRPTLLARMGGGGRLHVLCASGARPIPERVFVSLLQLAVAEPRRMSLQHGDLALKQYNIRREPV